MTTYLVHDAAGLHVSTGTVVADPLPDGLTAVALSDSDAAGLASGARRWNPTARAVEPTAGWVDPAVAAAATATNRQQLANALVVLDRLADGKTVASGTVDRTSAAHANAAISALAAVVRRHLRVTEHLGGDRTD